jgi:hypothetical protein
MFAKGLYKHPKNWNDECKKDKVHNPNYKLHLIAIPFRMFVIGQCGGGKTTFIIELIHRMSGTFEEIIICCRSKHQKLYEMLEEKCPTGVVFYENEIPPIDTFKDKKQRFIIFDDLLNDKKMDVAVSQYAIRGRHFNLSLAYLTQNYYTVPKIIRQQMNYIVMKKVGSIKDARMIVKEFGLELDAQDLFNLYKECTKDKGDFLMIDLEDDRYKYRHNFVPLKISTDEYMENNCKC